MKKFLKITGAVVFSALALTFSGCKVEPAYTLENLKNIDLDIAVFQNGIQLRLADSSSVFRVDSIMKSVGLDSSELIKQAPDGSYYISYSDKVDLGEDISGIGLSDAVEINALNVSEDINYTLEGFDLADLLATVPPALLGEYTIPDIHYDLDKKVEFDFLTGNDLPDMLVGIGEIALDEVYASIDLIFTDLPGNDDQEYALDATATLPSFCNPQTIELKGNIKKNQHFYRQIQILKLDLSDKDLVALRESGANLTDSVTVHGSVAAENVVVDLNNTATSVNGTIGVSIANANGKVDIESIQVKIDYVINETFTAPFFALPEAFSDATLDLPNATVNLTARTNMAIPITGSADLRAQGATQPAAVLNFEIPFSMNPAEYLEKTTHNDVSLNALLSEAADSIEFVANISTDKQTYCYIQPDATYGFELEYALNLPLALGAGTMIDYADTINLGADTGKQVGQILQESSIGFKANVKNTIPLSADLTIGCLAYNEEAGTYSDIPLSKPITVKLPDPGETGLIEVVIGAEKGNVALANLTDLKLSITVHANGQALKGDDYVVLTNLYLMLPNGIHIDANELVKPEENNNE